MTANTREAARPRTPEAAQHSPTETALDIYGAQMAVDCLIVVALFKAKPWLEIEITRVTLASLGNRPRHSCVCGTAIRLTREHAQREGWGWPTMDEVITQMALAQIRKESTR